MYWLFRGCLFPLACMCLQVQSELRRWLRKCHNQSHLTPAKRSITQITIRTREGLAGPPSSGNISSVWFFKNYPRGWSCQVEHQWPLSKLQTPNGIISTAPPDGRPSWTLLRAPWASPAAGTATANIILWMCAVGCSLDCVGNGRCGKKKKNHVEQDLVPYRCRKTRPEERPSWYKMQAGVMALLFRESDLCWNSSSLEQCWVILKKKTKRGILCQERQSRRH